MSKNIAMLVSHRKKFIFIKTVKTAGTSVESYFEKWCMNENEWVASHTREEYISESGIVGYRGGAFEGKTWYNHMPAWQVKNQIHIDKWNGYFKFTIIRNPFDKVISDFYFKKFVYDNSHLSEDAFFSNNAFNIENVVATITVFKKWIQEKKFSIDTDKYLINGKECLDCYILFENLNKGVRLVCEKLSIPYKNSEIPKLKSGIRNRAVPIEDFYDAESRKIVATAFSWEIKKFNYKFPE